MLSICNAATAVNETQSSLKSSTAAPGVSSVVFDINNYGAHGDGKHDDTLALAKAWDAACSSSRPTVLLVPKGRTYLLKFITLSGPCKSSIVFMVKAGWSLLGAGRHGATKTGGTG
jgi:polygalacturonase